MLPVHSHDAAQLVASTNGDGFKNDSGFDRRMDAFLDRMDSLTERLAHSGVTVYQRRLNTTGKPCNLALGSNLDPFP